MSESQPPPLPGDQRPDEAASLPEFVEESSFLRQFVFERRFRIAVAMFAVLGVFLGLFLPKLWTASPPGFVPEIKVSGLDKVQAWALRRTAARAERDGKVDEAVHAWRMAIVNDSCDPENSRGILRMLAGLEPPSRDYQKLGVLQTRWLIRLTGTNLADVGLSAKLLAHYEMDDLVVGDLLPFMSQLGREDRVQLLVSLFRLGEMERFHLVWDGSSEEVRKDPTARLFHAAWLAGWGPPGTIRAGQAELDAAKRNRETLVVAHRLQLTVSLALNDLRTYEESFQALEREHAQRLGEHVGLWRLLLEAGRRQEVERLVSASSMPPTTAAECAKVADVYAALGRASDAADYIGRYVDSFVHRGDLWIRRADLLVSAGKWESLREVAVQMRQIDGMRESLAGYAWFLEGLSELKRNRRENADIAFTNMLVTPLTDPLLGYRTATAMTQLGRPEMSQQLLDRLESNFKDRAEYWYQVEMAAYAVGDIERMMAAAERAFALSPDNAIIVNNYAAALIMMRQRPAEAVKLTVKKLALDPNDVGANLNHCLALLQNKRVSEARAVLVRFDPAKLQGVYRTVYYLADFEANYLEGKRSASLEAAQQVEARFLKPPQARWFEETRRKVADLPR